MVIAVDLGGTNMRVAAIENGKILQSKSEPCQATGTEEEVIEQLARLIACMPVKEATGIGIGVPSVVDADQGIVYNVVGIPSWQEVHLKEVLEKRFGLPVNLNNDCNCFALGVANFGEGKSYKETFCATLGTGVGGALVIDGTLYAGHNTGAGEIGSIPYLDKDYEFYCSSRFFVSKGTTGKEACEKAAEGDAAALAVWNEFGGHMGELVKMIMFAYDPAIIIFGGSIAQAYPLFEQPMWESIQSFPYEKSVERLKIIPTSLKDAGLIGAACLI
ncbi:MAG: ROK family protein [Bacteroidaceae bacterium]|nr:ROK family protein [Bacteroidaceae bacterium]MCF0187644.1 ROK family protein [Bacteroidaceae bacterium]